VWRALDRVLPREGRFLDLGCGTGEDAVWLARRGATEVVGCDASEAMLGVARRKADGAGVGERLSLHRRDLRRIGSEPIPGDGSFDGAVADFGVLNCLEDRRPVAEAVSRRLRPGAPFVIVVMGRWCAWEVAWHLLRLEPAAAFRRRRQGREVPLDGGGSVRVWYPSRRALRREFKPHFDHLETVGIGAFLPPPYLDPVLAARPRLLALLGRLETALADRRPWSWLADHALLVFRGSGRLRS
jgi:SAM-dependent methyltransferase